MLTGDLLMHYMLDETCTCRQGASLCNCNLIVFRPISANRIILDDQRSTELMIPCLLICLQGEDIEWIRVELESPNPSGDDWVGVFSPANFK